MAPLFAILDLPSLRLISVNLESIKPRCITKWPHSSGATFVAFASLRLGENRRLNEDPLPRKGAKGEPIYFSMTINAECAR